MRTEDLVQTAEKSANLRLAESTAVRITPRNNNVIITFSYDNNRSRVSGIVSLFYFMMPQQNLRAVHNIAVSSVDIEKSMCLSNLCDRLYHCLLKMEI